jgi:hypothetical protein
VEVVAVVVSLLVVESVYYYLVLKNKLYFYCINLLSVGNQSGASWGSWEEISWFLVEISLKSKRGKGVEIS